MYEANNGLLWVFFFQFLVVLTQPIEVLVEFVFTDNALDQ